MEWVKNIKAKQTLNLAKLLLGHAQEPEMLNVTASSSQQGKTWTEINKIMKHLNLSKIFMTKTVARFKEVGNNEDRSQTGRPRSKRTTQVVKRIREKVNWSPVRQITKLVYVNPGAKVNSKYSIERILKEGLLLWAQEQFGDNPWTFTQDGAPSQMSKHAQYFLKREKTRFLTKDWWPPSSRYINPLDFYLWHVRG